MAVIASKSIAVRMEILPLTSMPAFGVVGRTVLGLVGPTVSSV